MYGRVRIDLVQMHVDLDRDEYARWSVRAKCAALVLTPTRTEKTVRRAVRSAFAKARDREMAQLIDDLRWGTFRVEQPPPSRWSRLLSWLGVR